MYTIIHIGGGKMKIKANYNIEEDLKKEFDKIAKENALNRSSWLAIKMREYIKSIKK